MLMANCLKELEQEERLNHYALEKVVARLIANVKEQTKKNEEMKFNLKEEDLPMIRFIMDCAGERIKMVSKNLEK